MYIEEVQLGIDYIYKTSDMAVGIKTKLSCRIVYLERFCFSGYYYPAWGKERPVPGVFFAEDLHTMPLQTELDLEKSEENCPSPPKI